MNVSSDMEPSLFDFDKQCNLITTPNRESNFRPPLNSSNGVRDESTSTIRRLTLSDDGFYDHGGHRDEILEDIEDIRDLNHGLASKDSKLHSERSSIVHASRDGICTHFKEPPTSISWQCKHTS
ncbi:hypothetical protein VitviT2T_024389 [Vitis vinifera]|uniref:Uncharacterized protein n=1 Tax=Vitis vinifera TaxID=29760 RepID=A0ABY9DHJ9_VITVI|nr:hypothetical protein VitviT2T_024389 [Vitis vinifera]